MNKLSLLVFLSIPLITFMYVVKITDYVALIVIAGSLAFAIILARTLKGRTTLKPASERKLLKVYVCCCVGVAAMLTILFFFVRTIDIH